MAKFFRGFRRKFIKNGKASKYLLYAIGEIILVVIGILIALKINNWNESKKTTKNEITSLIEIRDALKLNQTIISNKRLVFQSRIIEGKRLEIHLQKKLPYHDSLQAYFPIPLRNYYYGLSYAAYENLKNTGLNNISDTELRLKIIEIYDGRLGLLRDQELKIASVLTNTLMPISVDQFSFIEDGLIPNNYEDIVGSSDYINGLTLMIEYSRQQIVVSNQVMDELNELISDINKSLNKIKGPE